MVDDRTVVALDASGHDAGIWTDLALDERGSDPELDAAERARTDLWRLGDDPPGWIGRVPRRPAGTRPGDPTSLRRTERNHVLFWQGGPGADFIRIVEGVVRAVHLSESGERQVLAFFWPGTIIRPDIGQQQFYTAETVTKCLLEHTRRPPGDASPWAPATDKQVLAELLDLVGGIGRRCAISRTAWFLLRMREHLPRISPNSEVLRFLVPRIDVADHLGLSLETVSRCLTELKVRNVIDLPDRKTIRFTNVPALARIASA